LTNAFSEIRALRAEIPILAKKFPEIGPRALRAYKEQYWFAKTFIQDYFGKLDYSDKRVLEVGAAEGGVLKYLTELGATCFGLELSPKRFDNSSKLVGNSKITFIAGDITATETFIDYNLNDIDYIILRDVIEHIHDKQSALKNVFSLLQGGGKVFISYPPYHAPFAGHQQTSGKLLAKIPYIHCLPDKLYHNYLRILGVSDNKIKYLANIKVTRVKDLEFLELCRSVGFMIRKYDSFIFRPEYKFRFSLPLIRNHFFSNKRGFNFLSSGVNLLLEKPVND